MLYFAYDGTIHGDWVSHYAVKLASAEVEKTLHLIHVREAETARGRPGWEELDEKFARLESECARLGVTLVPHLLKPNSDPLNAVLSTAQSGPGPRIVCGMRAVARQRGMLSGSFAGRLLREGTCPVLAIRVVHPGLLGLPRRLLLPVSDEPGQLDHAWPFLHQLRPQLTHLQLLNVVRVSRWRFRRLSYEAMERLREPSVRYCEQLEERLALELGMLTEAMDLQVTVSDDIPKEIVIAAHKSHSGLILLGASRRHLSERFVYGNPLEEVLRDATSDVAIYRGGP